MNFWKTFLAAFIALVAFSLFSLFLFLAILMGVASKEEEPVPDNAVLHLKLDARITEMQQEDPLALFASNAPPQIGLMQLRQVIEHAKTDDNIKGIYVDVRHPMAGFSTVEEIRESLIDFRKSGKWVVAYSEAMSEQGYYLATAADKIYLNPQGDVEFNGLTIEISFFKRLFDKLEINPQIFRVGAYKSAVEPFILEKMSDENRLQLTELANAIYDSTLQRIATARGLPAARLHEISDNMQVRNAATAKELGLVDDLFYQNEFYANLKERLGLGESDDINFIRYGKYRKTFSAYKSSGNEIAVVVADGTIMPGDAPAGDDVIAAQTFVETIRRVREDDAVKAIVVRINSPGGEFRASDMMWHELELAAAAKPVIASMSDYAASGGYYMAMACDTIVAQPNTITGSIGIFGMMFDMSSFLGNKIGITFDEVRTGEYGEMFTITRPLTESERNFWQKNLNDHYDTFIAKAAKGRGMREEDVRNVASGRVWSGSQAQTRKLVDILGGFKDAVNIAAAAAHIEDDYKLRYYPEEKPFIEELVNRLEGNAQAEAMQEELGDMYTWYQQLQKVKTYQGAQARMPFELQIH